MRPIDKFILHVVHNWVNEINEAYSKGAVDSFIAKFKEEADDLNINITDEQLKVLINSFDRIKEKLPSDQRDLTKYTLSKLIKLATASKGEEAPEEIDITPDVVYHNDDDTVAIYNGSKEGNCVRYGNGEKWCITKGSFANYRYQESKQYPTFYLAKNINLSDDDPLSFVAIQVKDPKLTSSSNRYVFTNRKNSPYESEPMSLDSLLNQIPWLRDIPNIESVLKYIPLSNVGTLTQKYKNSPTNIIEWSKFPFSTKQQYLVVRKGNKLFTDITTDEFVSKYLPKYPQIANFIATNYGVIDSITLLKHLDSFSNQDRRSITANLQGKIDNKELSLANFPFDVKKLLTSLNKWDLESSEKIYVTKDKSTIVKLNIGKKINISLYQEDDSFPNIKLNKRTSKFLLDYPALDQIPLKNLMDLASEGIIDKSILDEVLQKAKTDENSAIIAKETENGEIIIDTNAFASYKVDGEGNITSIPFDSEEVQNVLNGEQNNKSLQQNALLLIKDLGNSTIPSSIDKDNLVKIIDSIPYEDRIIASTSGRGNNILLTGEDNIVFFQMGANPNDTSTTTKEAYGISGDGIKRLGYNKELTIPLWRKYFAFLRQTNQSYNSDQLMDFFTSGYRNAQEKKFFIAAGPPLNVNNDIIPFLYEDRAYLLNRRNPDNSRRISDSTGSVRSLALNKAQLLLRLIQRQAAPVRTQVAPRVAPAVPAAPVAAAPAAAAPVVPQGPRRGRPPGGGNVPAPAPAGNLNTADVMQTSGLQGGWSALPILVRQHLSRSEVVPLGGGATRRNNTLQGRGIVTQNLKSARGGNVSAIYLIRLNSGQRIASIVVQPGNAHYVVTNNTAFRIDSPEMLATALQQRNIAESLKGSIVGVYLSENSNKLEETKDILKKYINFRKNEKSRTS